VRREGSFDITIQESLSFFLPPQMRIHVAKRESTHEEVSLFSGTQFPDRPHLLRNPSQLLGELHGPHLLVLLLDVVREVQVVCPAQDDHLFRPRSPFE
jgi:hypothetical protein